MKRGVPGWVRPGMAAGLAGMLMLSACSTPTKTGLDAAALRMPPRSRYILKVTEVVDKQWHLYLQQRRNEAAFGGMEVGYWVNKLGKVEKMAVVGANKASPDLSRLTLNAIRDAKLPRMPADVVSSLTAKDEGCLKLTYKAYIPAPAKGGRRTALDAQLTAEERAALEPRVLWNQKHASSDLAYTQFLPGSKSIDLGKETPNALYGRLMMGAVLKKWHPYLRQSQHAAAGEMDVVFYVNAQGKVVSTQATNPKNCTPGLKELTLRAVRDAEIPPMPANVTRIAAGPNKGLLKGIFHARTH